MRLNYKSLKNIIAFWYLQLFITLNLSQILEYIQKILKIKVNQSYHAIKYIFIGDKTEEGGNDHALAKVMDEMDDCNYHQVKGWEQTKEVLESYWNK